MFTETERDLCGALVRWLTFAPCVSESEFVSWIIEYELGLENYSELMTRHSSSFNEGEEKGAKYSQSYLDEYNKARKRCSRLLNHFVSDSNASYSLSHMIALPKVYDDLIRKHQIELYNSVVLKLNEIFVPGTRLPLITHTISMAQAMGVSDLDEIENSKKVIEQCYPYLYYTHFEERKGLTLIECMILLNIIETYQGRRLGLLPKIISHSLSREVSQGWLEEVFETMQSDDSQRIYIEMLIYEIRKVNFSIYEENAEDFLRKVWLPEKYSKRKDFDLVYQKHRLCIAKSMEEILASVSEFEGFKFLQQKRLFDELPYMEWQVISGARSHLIQKYKTRKELDYDTYMRFEGEFYRPEQYEDFEFFVRTYIDAMLYATRSILEDLLIC